MDEIVIRECVSIEEFDSCVHLQREVFGLPEIEVSPRRHLIVSRQAGGWTLGAFAADRLIGFVHHLAAVRGQDEVFGYSHMMAVALEYQNKGVGARLKWRQRARAIEEGRSLIKWTWDPMQARNAYFNLNRLGVTVDSYAENFYGTDYPTSQTSTASAPLGIDSDRLFANWDLHSRRVGDLAEGAAARISVEPRARVQIPQNWGQLIKDNPALAKKEQLRVRSELKNALASGLICAGFERFPKRPCYLLYEPDVLDD